MNRQTTDGEWSQKLTPQFVLRWAKNLQIWHLTVKMKNLEQEYSLMWQKMSYLQYEWTFESKNDKLTPRMYINLTAIMKTPTTRMKTLQKEWNNVQHECTLMTAIIKKLTIQHYECTFHRRNRKTYTQMLDKITDIYIKTYKVFN